MLICVKDIFTFSNCYNLPQLEVYYYFLEVENSSIIMVFPFYRKQPKAFAFDHCFCSVDSSKEDFASQEVVFNNLGRDILDNAFQGYNACIFAYGQTGKIYRIFYFYTYVLLINVLLSSYISHSTLHYRLFDKR